MAVPKHVVPVPLRRLAGLWRPLGRLVGKLLMRIVISFQIHGEIYVLLMASPEDLATGGTVASNPDKLMGPIAGHPEKLLATEPSTVAEQRIWDDLDEVWTCFPRNDAP